MQKESHHHDQHHNGNGPVKHNIVMQKREHDHDQIRQPSKCAETAATTHEIFNQAIHTQGLIRLNNGKHFGIQWAGIYAHVKTRGRASGQLSLRATKFTHNCLRRWICVRLCKHALHGRK